MYLHKLPRLLLILMLVASFLPVPPARAAGPIGPITLVDIATGFNNPVGIDYHEPTNKVAMSVYYPSGAPHNFELVAGDGSRAQFSTVSGLTDELKIATVRSGPCQGGFNTGDLFSGTGTPGHILRIAPDGSSFSNPWVVLPGETGLMRGSLFQDRYCAFGGDLMVVTTAGNIWRVNSAGVPTKVRPTSLGTHLEGVTTVPNNPAKYGPWAGKALVGAEGQSRIYAIAPDGTTTFYDLGIAPEDFDIVPPNENFFGVNFSGAKLVGAPAAAFSGIVGDLVIAQESGPLWHVWWDGAAFQKEALATVAQWEHVTFAPSGVVNILPVFSGNEGAAIPISGSTNLAGPITATWSYAPTGSVDAGATCTFGPQGLSTTITCTDDGLYNLTLTVTNGSTTVTATTTLNVSNVAPAITALSAASINENDSVTLTGSFTDPGANDAHTVLINWGDGSPPETLPVLPAGVLNFSATHQYLDDNPTGTPADPATITVIVTDDDNASDTTTHTLLVSNVAPTVSITAPADYSIHPVNTALGLSASFTDPGTLDTHTCSINWGDASSTAGTVGAGSCSGSHTYTLAGVYTVSLTFTDDDTGTDNDEITVVVYDPSAGFVTGGGWIVSPEDACGPAAPAGVCAGNPTGRANFGFVSKYQKGASTPTGQTEFQFQAGNLTFHSEDYQWLLVSACFAQYKGTGTINGVAGYSFRVSARDGNACSVADDDGFRIQIWNMGSGGLVYDNGLGAPDVLGPAGNPTVQDIAGGSIVIHTGGKK